jgi:hypothetical protein
MSAEEGEVSEGELDAKDGLVRALACTSNVDSLVSSMYMIASEILAPQITMGYDVCVTYMVWRLCGVGCECSKA